MVCAKLISQELSKHSFQGSPFQQYEYIVLLDLYVPQSPQNNTNSIEFVYVSKFYHWYEIPITQVPNPSNVASTWSFGYIIFTIRFQFWTSSITSRNESEFSLKSIYEAELKSIELLYMFNLSTCKFLVVEVFENT